MASLPEPDRQATLAFQKQTGELQRTVYGAYRVAQETAEQLKYIRRALDTVPGVDPNLAVEARALELRLQDMLERFEGDPTKPRRNEPGMPGILSRVQTVVSGHWTTTYGPTNSHRRSYEIAAEEYGALQDELRKLVEQDVAGTRPQTRSRRRTLDARSRHSAVEEVGAGFRLQAQAPGEETLYGKTTMLAELLSKAVSGYFSTEEPRSRCAPKPAGVRPEPQRGGSITARGKPRFAAPPRVSPRPARRGRAHDPERKRRCPSPPRAAPCLVAAEPDDAPVCIAPSKACEAVRGLFRSRRPPVWHTVLGSTARFSGTCTRGRAAKRGLPRAMIGPPRCGSGGKRNCHEHKNSNGARYILHSKRLINGTNVVSTNRAVSPRLSPPTSNQQPQCPAILRTSLTCWRCCSSQSSTPCRVGKLARMPSISSRPMASE